jgi:hypothetical protein
MQIPTLLECIPVKMLKAATKIHICPDSCFTWIAFCEISQTVKPFVAVTCGMPSRERP